MTQKKIVIVGAGIVGVMLAWHLATYSKANVILLDQDHAGSGVSQHSFAWLNVSYGRPDAYQKLRAKALDEWRTLDATMQGALNIHWRGAISWQATDDATTQFIQSHSAQNFKVETLTAAALAIKEPSLQQVPNIIAFAADEGAIDPQWVIQTLLQDAIKKGITYCPNMKVSQILQNESGQTVGVATASQQYLADRVVLTAGISNSLLTALLDIKLPLSASPAIIIRFKHISDDKIAQHIISTPDMEIRALDAQHLLAAEDYIDESPENDPALIAQNALETIQTHFAAAAPTFAASLTIDHIKVGLRPMPQDEMPIVGNISDDTGLYVISMHAAITLAPLIVRLAMPEILTQEASSALAPYRITRFQ